MVGKILLVGIPLRNPQSALGNIGIPANKIYRITKVVAIMAPIASVFAIVIPGWILCLSIAISRGSAG